MGERGTDARLQRSLTMRYILIAAIILVAVTEHAQAQLGGSPSPGAPATTAPTPAAPPTAPGAPRMTPFAPQSHPMLPPGTPGANVPARNPLDPTPPVPVQNMPQPNTAQPGPPTLPTAPGSVTPEAPAGAGQQQPAASAGQQQGQPSPPLSGFATCMLLWDKGLDMTKRQWAASCRDTISPSGGSVYGSWRRTHIAGAGTGTRSKG